MKRYLILLLVWICAPGASGAQEQVRPYEEWEATQFVMLRGHQPSDYVAPDNNWEILYRLRTPHTLAELQQMGVKCSQSQLMLLEVGGLIAKTEGKWKSSIPILDERQTRSLRSYSKEIAQSIYDKTKAEFISLSQTIERMGFENNALSLVFSYLLDGRMWTKLVLFEDINNHTSWSGCYWILYEPRAGIACGTNGYGNQDLILTYQDSSIALDPETMDACAAEIARFGKITDAALIAELQPCGVVDGDGNLSIPVIRREQDRFHRITDALVESISTELKQNCTSLSTLFGIEEQRTAMVVLYHEVMWELMDQLLQDEIISIPPIFKDKRTNRNRLSDVLFFVEGGLMQ